MFKVINTENIVEGNTYLVVCDDGIMRYLTAEFSSHLDNHVFKELVFYDVHGTEQYRTYNPELVFEIGVTN